MTHYLTPQQGILRPTPEYHHRFDPHCPSDPQAPMQPVVAVELFPMPQARLESFARVQTSQSGEEEVTEKRSVPVRMGGHFDDASEISVEDAATLGSNIFALLVVGMVANNELMMQALGQVGGRPNVIMVRDDRQGRNRPEALLDGWGGGSRG